MGSGKEEDLYLKGPPKGHLPACLCGTCQAWWDARTSHLKEEKKKAHPHMCPACWDDFHCWETGCRGKMFLECLSCKGVEREEAT